MCVYIATMWITVKDAIVVMMKVGINAKYTCVAVIPMTDIQHKLAVDIAIIWYEYLGKLLDKGLITLDFFGKEES